MVSLTQIHEASTPFLPLKQNNVVQKATKCGEDTTCKTCPDLPVLEHYSIPPGSSYDLRKLLLYGLILSNSLLPAMKALSLSPWARMSTPFSNRATILKSMVYF
jgi:hypothetical protein